MKLEFSAQIFEYPYISNFTYIRPVAADFLHANWRTCS